MDVLVVDGANVVGSVPDGWWRDRAGAAARLHAGLRRLVAHAGSPAYGLVVLVLEGQARAGVPAAADGPVVVVHASGEGDDDIVAVCRALAAANPRPRLALATADRGLIGRLTGLRLDLVGPRDLRRRLDAPAA